MTRLLIGQCEYKDCGICVYDYIAGEVDTDNFRVNKERQIYCPHHALKLDIAQLMNLVKTLVWWE